MTCTCCAAWRDSQDSFAITSVLSGPQKEAARSNFLFRSRRAPMRGSPIPLRSCATPRKARCALRTHSRTSAQRHRRLLDHRAPPGAGLHNGELEHNSQPIRDNYRFSLVGPILATGEGPLRTIGKEPSLNDHHSLHHPASGRLVRVLRSRAPAPFLR